MITEAITHDIPAIQQIAKTTWAETYGKILSPEQMNYMLDMFYSTSSLKNQMQNNHLFFVLKEEAEIIGFIDVEKISKEITKLNKLYLLPTKQKKGYGKLLLHFAIGKAKEQDTKILQLNVNRFNTTAINFYNKSGFRIADIVDNPIGNGFLMNDYVMEKKL